MSNPVRQRQPFVKLPDGGGGAGTEVVFSHPGVVSAGLSGRYYLRGPSSAQDVRLSCLTRTGTLTVTVLRNGVALDSLAVTSGTYGTETWGYALNPGDYLQTQASGTATDVTVQVLI